MFCQSSRAGVLNINTSSTVLNTINIGSNSTITNFSGLVNVPTIKNCSIIDNSGVILIGNTSATDITIGRANININVPGYLVANLAGFNTIGVIGSETPMSLWYGSIGATANILGREIRTGILNIQAASTLANTINMGSATTTTNFAGTIKCNNGTNTNTIRNISVNDTTSIFDDNISGVISIANNVSRTAILNLMTNNFAASISNTINLGGYGTRIYVGGTVTLNQMTHSGGTTSHLFCNMTTQDVYMFCLSTRAGTLNINTSSTVANTINIGTNTTITNISGVINASLIRNCSSIDNSGTLFIGNVSATDVSIGRSGRNINIMGTLVAYTSTLNDIGTYGASNAMNLWFGSTDGTATILGRGIRTGILNIQAASTLANTINMGSSTTTTTLGGVVNASTIKNCSFIDNQGTIVIGNISSTGITIGRSGQVTDISGNLQIGGSATRSGTNTFTYANTSVGPNSKDISATTVTSATSFQTL
jgi:hypothetical protein